MRCYDGDIAGLWLEVVQRGILLDRKLQSTTMFCCSRPRILANMLAINQMLGDDERRRRHHRSVKGVGADDKGRYGSRHDWSRIFLKEDEKMTTPSDKASGRIFLGTFWCWQVLLYILWR